MSSDKPCLVVIENRVDDALNFSAHVIAHERVLSVRLDYVVGKLGHVTLHFFRPFGCGSLREHCTPVKMLMQYDSYSLHNIITIFPMRKHGICHAIFSVPVGCNLMLRIKKGTDYFPSQCVRIFRMLCFQQRPRRSTKIRSHRQR